MHGFPEDVLAWIRESGGARRPSGSAASIATACTINVHAAGQVSGYVQYGRMQARKLSQSRGSPYGKFKIKPFGSAEDVAERVAVELRKALSPVSPTSPICSPLPASDFEDAVVEAELHRESSVSVERCQSRGKSWVFKAYHRKTMPTHPSLEDQQAYELNLYYKDLKDLPNIVQLQAHFCDPLSQRLTMVLPDLGVNIYPRDKPGIISYMRQMMSALQSLWGREIVHCNIKGGPKPNAIFDRRGKFTLIDFESAVRRHELIDQEARFGTEIRAYVGNQHYVAPEVLVAQRGQNPYGGTYFGRRRDVFSAGIVFAELLLDVEYMLNYNDMPSSFVTTDDIVEAHYELDRRLTHLSPRKALQCYGSFRSSDAKFNKLGTALIAKMLARDRVNRPSSSAVLQDPFFRYRFESV